MHRIAAKRVIIELQNSPLKSRIKSGKRRFNKSPLATLLLVIIVSSVIAMFLGLPSADSKSTVATDGLASVSQMKLCASLARETPVEIHDVTAFEFEGWAVTTSGREISLGALKSISFEARCESKIALGSLLYSNIESGYLILRMTPIKRPGS